MSQLIGAQNIMVEHSLHPPSLFKEGESKFWLPPPEGASEKLKKVWKYRAGADLFKRRGAGTFPFIFFKFYHFYI